MALEEPFGGVVMAAGAGVLGLACCGGQTTSQHPPRTRQSDCSHTQRTAQNDQIQCLHHSKAGFQSMQNRNLQ